MTGGRTMERDRRSSETRASTDPSRALAPVRESGAGEAAEPVVMMGGLGRHLGLAWLENVFFFAVMICSFVFAVLLLREATWSWSLLLLLVGFWAVMAYLALPRLHRVLTTIYVPDYFIGCSRTTDGRLGDPLNLAFIGDEQQIHETMTRAGWVKADPVTLGSSVRIVVSSLLRRSYAEAPVSPLVLFRRTQEFAYQQEVDGNPSQRHHVRFWPTPDGWLLPGGRRVDWLASGTFDSGVGLSFFTLQVTHRIARDIDTERDHVLRTVTDAGPAVSVEMLHDFTSGYHSRNGGGDAVMTDGDLPVVAVFVLGGAHDETAGARHQVQRPAPDEGAHDAAGRVFTPGAGPQAEHLALDRAHGQARQVGGAGELGDGGGVHRIRGVRVGGGGVADDAGGVRVDGAPRRNRYRRSDGQIADGATGLRAVGAVVAQPEDVRQLAFYPPPAKKAFAPERWVILAQGY